MRLEQYVQRVVRGKLAMGSDGKWLDRQVCAAEMRNGFVIVAVGDLHDGLGDPPIVAIIGREYWVVRSGLLPALDGDGRELPGRAVHREQRKRGVEVFLQPPGALSRFDSIEDAVVHEVESAFRTGRRDGVSG